MKAYTVEYHVRGTQYAIVYGRNATEARTAFENGNAVDEWSVDDFERIDRGKIRREPERDGEQP